MNSAVKAATCVKIVYLSHPPRPMEKQISYYNTLVCSIMCVVNTVSTTFSWCATWYYGVQWREQTVKSMEQGSMSIPRWRDQEYRRAWLFFKNKRLKKASSDQSTTTPHHQQSRHWKRILRGELCSWLVQEMLVQDGLKDILTARQKPAGYIRTM